MLIFPEGRVKRGIMQTFLISFGVFLVAFLGMAVGVLLHRRGIQGSCGGISRLLGAESSCGEACSRPCPRRQAQAGVQGVDTERA
jgi:uncharacterized protein